MITTSSEVAEMTTPSRLPHPVIDNRCMLAAIARGAGRYKGIAMVRNDVSRQEPQDLQGQGIAGAAFNLALLEAFTPQSPVWDADWPFIRAPARIDDGPLLHLVTQWLPEPAARQAVLRDTPHRLFGVD